MPEAPVLAVVGHPNEGKSSVVSTLTEDDRVRISARPGETEEATAYAIRIDGVERLRLIDTPGFQMPRATLRWITAEAERHPTGAALLEAFLAAHRDQPEFVHDCRILEAVHGSQGLLLVLDASKPVTDDDRAEMEILRYTGLPRMALLNSKADQAPYEAEWRTQLTRSFSAVRTFNAQRATFVERIKLLEALQSIHQEWESELRSIVAALREDWLRRLEETAEKVVELVAWAVTFKLTRRLGEGESPLAAQQQMLDDYTVRLAEREERVHEAIRGLFRHRIFDPRLEADEVQPGELFAGETWEVLGLTQGQLAAVGALSGAALGAAGDVAASGLTFGVLTAAGAAAGIFAGYASAKPLASIRVRVGRMESAIGGRQITVGPARTPQLMFVLIDRAVRLAVAAANWAHARREGGDQALAPDAVPRTRDWPRARRQPFVRLYRRLRNPLAGALHETERECRAELVATLREPLFP